MMLKYLLITLLFISSSCSYYIKLREYDSDVTVIPQSPPKAHCTNVGKRQLEIAGASSSNAEIFHTVLKQISKEQQLSIIDQGVLLSLLQMNITPHLSAPTANITLAITKNKKQEYFHFTNNADLEEKHQYPYLYGLDYILKYYRSHLSLLRLASLLDKHLVSFVKVDDKLETFLKENSSAMLKDKPLAKVFLRARQPLKKEESISRLKFAKIVRSYLKYKKADNYLISQNLISQTKNNNRLACNFDFEKFSKQESEIYPAAINSNTFALQNRANDVFIASSSQEISTIRSILSAPLFAGTPTDGIPAMCLYSDSQKQTQMTIYSSKGRDPKQYLYDIIQSNILGSQSILEVYDQLSNPRTLHLTNPTRIVVESNKSSYQQLDSLFKTHTPIYHAKALGNVWVHASFPQNATQGIVIDPRNTDSIYCP